MPFQGANSDPKSPPPEHKSRERLWRHGLRGRLSPHGSLADRPQGVLQGRLLKGYLAVLLPRDQLPERRHGVLTGHKVTFRGVEAGKCQNSDFWGVPTRALCFDQKLKCVSD